MQTLIAWIGHNDLWAAGARKPKDDWVVSDGPIVGLVKAMADDGEHRFDRVLALVAGIGKPEAEAYVGWARRQLAGLGVAVQPEWTGIKHRGPARDAVVDYGKLMEVASAGIERLKAKRPDAVLAYHLSPGTPAMIAVSLLLSQTKHPGKTYQSAFEANKTDGTHGSRGIPVDIEPVWKSVLPYVLSAEARAGSARHPGLVYDSEAIRAVVAKLDVVSKYTRLPVAIYGETGTGKEQLARRVHDPNQVDCPKFRAVNCGAVTDELFASELFGHRKGAFTGAVGDRVGKMRLADEGTLFLDEVTELSPANQVVLLRALQPVSDGRFEFTPVGGTEPEHASFRVVVASNRRPSDAVAAGDFREDLYYRLADVEIEVPPLRDRPEDVLAFLEVEEGLGHLLKQTLGVEKPRAFSPEARDLLARGCEWRGNYRELRRVLVRLHLGESPDEITPDEVEAALDTRVGDEEGPLRAALAGIRLGRYGEVVNEVHRSFLGRALKRSSGNQSKASKLLALKSRQALAIRLKQHPLKGI